MNTMKKDLTYYHSLIHSYLAGEADNTGITELLEWIKLSDENRQEFESMKKTWQAVEKSKIESKLNIDEDWEAIKTKTNLDKEEPKVIIMESGEYQRPKFFRSFIRVAALFVLFGVFTIKLEKSE